MSRKAGDHHSVLGAALRFAHSHPQIKDNQQPFPLLQPGFSEHESRVGDDGHDNRLEAGERRNDDRQRMRAGIEDGKERNK